MQPIAQDIPEQDSIIHVHVSILFTYETVCANTSKECYYVQNSGPKVQPENLKKPATFQHLDYDNPGNMS